VVAEDDEPAGELKDFLSGLHEAFEGRRLELLEARRRMRSAAAAGELPSPDPATRALREGSWRVAAPPEALLDRRVELIAGAGREGLLSAMRAGARVVVVDLEHALPPGREALVATRAALRERWAGGFEGEKGLPDPLPPVVVRPRALHRRDGRVIVGGEAMAASLVDAGHFLFHAARPALAAGDGPFLSLPKLESAAEAVFWDDVLAHAEAALGLGVATVRTGVVVETLPAALAVDEILHALSARVTHLDVGRRGAVRSFVETVGARADRLLPDPDRIVPGMAFLRALSLLVVARGHARGTLALAGASTRCPADAGEEATTEAAEKLRADAERAAMDGHDGIRVAHPDFVPVAMEVFDRMMPEQNQVARERPDVDVGPSELFAPHDGARTQEGIRAALAVLLGLARARLGGRAAGRLGGEVLDIPAAEAAHAILSQWTRAGAALEDGRTVTPGLVDDILAQEGERAGTEAIDLVRTLLAAQGLPHFVDVEDALRAGRPAGGRN